MRAYGYNSQLLCGDGDRGRRHLNADLRRGRHDRRCHQALAARQGLCEASFNPQVDIAIRYVLEAFNRTARGCSKSLILLDIISPSTTYLEYAEWWRFLVFPWPVAVPCWRELVIGAPASAKT